MGAKTCETLREIERNREYHLNEQGKHFHLVNKEMRCCSPSSESVHDRRADAGGGTSPGERTASSGARGRSGGMGGEEESEQSVPLSE